MSKKDIRFSIEGNPDWEDLDEVVQEQFRIVAFSALSDTLRYGLSPEDKKEGILERKAECIWKNWKKKMYIPEREETEVVLTAEGVEIEFISDND